MSVERCTGRFLLAALSGIVLSACSPSASTAVPPVSLGQAPTAAPPAAAAPVAPLVTGLPDFTQLVERYGPAVVNVQVDSRPQPTLRSRGQEVLTQVSAELGQNKHVMQAVAGAMRGKERVEEAVSRVVRQMNVPTRSGFGSVPLLPRSFLPRFSIASRGMGSAPV